MDKRRDPASPRIRTRERGRWVFLFMVAPSVALLSFVAPGMGWSWVLVAAAILVLSGYRIWRIDHPGESARYEIGWRAQSLLTAAGFVVLVLVLEVTWVWVLAGLAVVTAIFLVIYAVANREPWRGPPQISEAPPKLQQDEPPEGS
jgi:hypothetical protein